MTKRISMWASPRNISTAIMYSFAQRRDCSVVDEPLYGYYLKQTEAKDYHPGAKEIMKSLPTDETEALYTFFRPEQQMVFYKQMTHHLLTLNREKLLHMDHIFLTRHPKEMVASFSKVIPSPKMSDIGYEDQVKLMEYLISKGKSTPVIDASQFLKNPELALRKICDYLKIPFDSNMLKWTAGARKEDGVWAKYWYGNIHQSTGFQPWQPKDIHLNKELNQLVEDCMPYYQYMCRHRLI